MIKIFGIGNILLCDDGIGVKVIEVIGREVENYGENVKVILGETDYLYCLDQIEDEDIVIIVDSTFLGRKAGEVSSYTFQQSDDFISDCRDMHSDSLLKILRKEYRHIQGYLIGIEVEKVDYSLELSKTLDDKFLNITMDVIEEIKTIVKLTKY
ncbi:MAG: hydrogenase maturation protease [Clostridium sp.]|uniref:hydrogenase maturation protease n=1 Tax=Clostridium sp. TaxID=1506 RepID=UPI003044C6EA